MNKSLYLMVCCFLLFSGCHQKNNLMPDSRTTDDVKQAIRNGEAGESLAEEANKDSNFSLEVIDTNIPYDVYWLCTYKSGYSILDYENRLILLCDGFGGGRVDNCSLSEEEGRLVLNYEYTYGSGVTWRCKGRYVLGETEAEWPLPDEECTID